MDMRQRHSIVQEIIDQEEAKRLQAKIDICEAVRMASAKNEEVRRYAGDIRQEIINLRFGDRDDFYTDLKKTGKKGIKRF